MQINQGACAKMPKITITSEAPYARTAKEKRTTKFKHKSLQPPQDQPPTKCYKERQLQWFPLRIKMQKHISQRIRDPVTQARLKRDPVSVALAVVNIWQLPKCSSQITRRERGAKPLLTDMGRPSGSACYLRWFRASCWKAGARQKLFDPSIDIRTTSTHRVQRWDIDVLSAIGHRTSKSVVYYTFFYYKENKRHRIKRKEEMCRYSDERRVSGCHPQHPQTNYCN